MKKILLILLLPLFINAQQIIVGSTGLLEEFAMSGDYTWIELGNPSQYNGTIDSVKFVTDDNEVGLQEKLLIGTFFNVSGDVFSTRDSSTTEAFTSTANQYVTVALVDPIEIQVGDYIGHFGDVDGFEVQLELDLNSGNGSGYYYKANSNEVGNQDVTFVPGDPQTRGYNLQGIGTATVEDTDKGFKLFPHNDWFKR